MRVEPASRAPTRGVVLRPLAVLLAVAGAGCTTVQATGSQQTALMEATKTKAIAGDLRAVDNMLAVSVPGTIEAAANTIMTQTSDPALQREALLFKLEVVPAFYQALFYSDPLAAALDAWALSIQLEDFLESRGKRLGELLPVALKAARTVRAQIETAAKEAAKTPEGFERARSKVESWARANPILGPFSSRPSILPELATLAAGGLDISVFQVVANIPVTVQDIATRIDIYSAYLPKAAHWHAELLVFELADRSDAQQVMATFESVQKMMERTNLLLSPESLQGALQTARGEVRAEGNAVLASVDTQRVETLAYLTRERAAAVADIDRERVTLLRELDELRSRSLRDVEDLSARLIRRGALAGALLLLLAAALAFAVVRLAPRRQTGAA
jgi:hypothetical protein